MLSPTLSSDHFWWLSSWATQQPLVNLISQHGLYIYCCATLIYTVPNLWWKLHYWEFGEVWRFGLQLLFPMCNSVTPLGINFPPGTVPTWDASSQWKLWFEYIIHVICLGIRSWKEIWIYILEMPSVGSNPTYWYNFPTVWARNCGNIL